MAVQKWSDRIWVAQLAAGTAFNDDMAYLQAHAAEGDVTPDIVLDLSSVVNINSANLAQILALRRMLVERGARLRLTSPTDAVWALILTTGLDKIFEFTTDTTTALAELQLKH